MHYAQLCSVISTVRAWISFSGIRPVASPPKFPFPFITDMPFFVNFPKCIPKWSCHKMRSLKTCSIFLLSSHLPMSLLFLPMPIAKQLPLARAWEKASLELWSQFVLGQHTALARALFSPGCTYYHFALPLWHTVEGSDDWLYFYETGQSLSFFPPCWLSIKSRVPITCLSSVLETSSTSQQDDLQSTRKNMSYVLGLKQS